MNGHDPLARVGPAIRAVREGQGTSLRGLARALGIPHGHLSQIESGRIARPGKQLLEAIATELGMTVGEIDQIAQNMTKSRQALFEMDEHERALFDSLFTRLSVPDASGDVALELPTLQQGGRPLSQERMTAIYAGLLVRIVRRTSRALDQVRPEWRDAPSDVIAGIIAEEVEKALHQSDGEVILLPPGMLPMLVSTKDEPQEGGRGAP
jgi:transcriptional regulator with XRE-family HTH domain